ncbi:peroxisomal targeting signal 2 receptor [Culicoides brevitarsis]|uniref:peroxisomal targeting signal 2 receptor n=1 Tax=Culicoides brevitarsis TaxID=469753 RepID=UPI00307B76F4
MGKIARFIGDGFRNMASATNKMPHFKIPADQHGSAVKFSPFHRNRLAVSASQPFGGLGAGALFILNCTDDLFQEQKFQWQDALFDVVWSKNNENQVLTSSGDGSLQLWDLTENGGAIQVFKEHSAEVYSVDWATINQNPQMLSGGWDGKVKLWDPTRKNSIMTFEHGVDSKCEHNSLFSSVGSDHLLRIWNLHEKQPISVIKTKGNEILCCDWVEKSENIVGIGTDNGNSYIFDLRHAKKEVACLKSGGETAIRGMKFSPHETSIVATVGYDSITRIWDFNNPKEPLEAICQHMDCVCGVDWDPFNAQRMADCGWDSIINVFNVNLKRE